ncbi:MAG: pyridoxamine 5'-phosphate oxidase family protein [Methylococcales bacterium]|nr:pyridoxamine 5'-phosphate oxidase family protein [Methylococcales bacterium]
MSAFYSPDQQHLQDQHDTRKLADRLGQMIVEPQINPQHQGFIESRNFFFLTTIDHRGYPTCSYKGGNPGFVRVLDPQTLAFPSYDGNGMFLSMGNILGNPKVGLLFIDFEHPHRIRIHGDASISANDPLLVDYPEADMIVRISISEVFINCPRYIHRMTPTQASKYVPQADATTPLPPWKRIDAIQDVLPTAEQDIAEKMGGVISFEDYAAMLMAGEM